LKAIDTKSKEKLLIRACHICLRVNESSVELERCAHCKKPFLPLRYFEKIHQAKEIKFEQHFSSADHLEEEDLVKGLFVLW
jgi:Zn-finger nucleic acid-binding protein